MREMEVHWTVEAHLDRIEARVWRVDCDSWEGVSLTERQKKVLALLDQHGRSLHRLLARLTRCEDVTGEKRRSEQRIIPEWTVLGDRLVRAGDADRKKFL